MPPRPRPRPTPRFRPDRPIKLDPLPEYPEIILALNLSTARPPSFHWLLFVPDYGTTRQQVIPGTKMHALCHLSPGPNGTMIEEWVYDSAKFTLVQSHTLAAAVVLGRLPPGKTVQDLNALLAAIPMRVPTIDARREPAFTCRVWTREAVRRMHDHGYICCPDVDALEEEVWEYGREAARKHDDKTFTIASLVVAVNSHNV
ncbi:hypothetical protein VTO73DRAFT_3120 [Trametes versicolor]